MEPFILSPDPENLNQRFSITVPLETGALRADLHLRWLPKPGQWYLSLRDGTTDRPLATAVPLIACDATRNDLFLPFRHEKIGRLYCRPNCPEARGRDPGETTLSQYDLIWTE